MKKRKLTDNKTMRSAHGLYFSTIDPLVHIHMYDPPGLEIFVYERCGSALPDA